MKVGIIKYGLGNIGSLESALRHIGANYICINSPRELLLADKLILPGVGNFTDAKKSLDDYGWTGAILSQVIEKEKSLLGICVGMQLLASYGEEGAKGHFLTDGLNLIPGRVVHLSNICNANRFPHIGWNAVKKYKSNSKIFSSIRDNTDFYFVHSYALNIKDDNDCAGISDYSGTFVSAVEKERVWGVQFHPEKSSYAGLKVLQNFLEA